MFSFCMKTNFIIFTLLQFRDTRTVNCVRNTAWRRRKQTQNCAPFLASQLALSLSNTWVTETWAASPSAGCVACVSMCARPNRGSVRNTRFLGPTMTAQGQSIGISLGMLSQTLIMSITVQKTSKYYTTEFDLVEGTKRSMYQHFQFTGEYNLTNS